MNCYCRDKKVEPEVSGKLTPVVSDEPEVSRTADNVEQNAPASIADTSSGIKPEFARSASLEALDEGYNANGIMCVDGSLPCPDDSGGMRDIVLCLFKYLHEFIYFLLKFSL